MALQIVKHWITGMFGKWPNEKWLAKV